MGSEAVHDTLGLGAIGGGFFLGVWPVAIGDLQPRERTFKIHSYVCVHALCIIIIPLPAILGACVTALAFGWWSFHEISIFKVLK